MAPLPSLKSVLTQAFPPKPQFTEDSLPDLKDKVYIVTGSNTGTGKELSRLLYTKNARVYMMARSEEKTSAAIAEIQEAVPASSGSLHFIKLDLADFGTVDKAVQRFLALETKLHVLFNNAGVLLGGKKLACTPSHELHTSVNALGPYLLSRLLTPTLAATARSEPPSTVRVVWTSSSAAEFFAEEKIGLSPEALDVVAQAARGGGLQRYWLSKVAGWAHAAEYARRHQADGIVSVAVNPGNLRSDLYRNQGLLFKVVAALFMYPPVNGAYTELFAGLSPEVNIENTGCWGESCVLLVDFAQFYEYMDTML